MKIVILDAKTLGKDISLDIFKTLGDVRAYDLTQNDDILQRIDNAEIIITNKVVITKEHMKKSNLKLICISATGMNNVDLEVAKELGIEVKNVAGYSSSSVAQVAFSMIFHFVNKLDYYKKYTDDGKWQKSDIFTHIDKPFYELDNKRIGVIGLGDIGKSFALRAKAFNSEVVYYSTSGKNSNNEYKQVSLEELLSTSDIVSIHCPLNEDTVNLLHYKNMKTMKDGAILLNLGRGGIINEEDLAKILDEKEIYAGIDVVSIEPIQESNPLLKVKNKERLLLTPHIGWASIEARTKLVSLVAKNIEDFLAK